METYESIEDGVSPRKTDGVDRVGQNHEQYPRQHRDFAGPGGLPALFVAYVSARTEPAIIFPLIT